MVTGPWGLVYNGGAEDARCTGIVCFSEGEPEHDIGTDLDSGLNLCVGECIRNVWMLMKNTKEWT